MFYHDEQFQIDRSSSQPKQIKSTTNYKPIIHHWWAGGTGWTGLKSLVLLAAAAEALQAVLAGLVAAEAAAEHEGAGIEEALLLVALLDVLHGRQLPVVVALWRRLIHRRCLFSLFPTETSEHCSVLTEDGWQLVIR